MNEGVSSGKIMDTLISLATLAFMGMIGWSVFKGIAHSNSPTYHTIIHLLCYDMI
jgi:hypothetical protein